MEIRFVASLADVEQQTLASAYDHGKKRALRHWAHAILLSDQGHNINQISGILQVRRGAVPRYYEVRCLLGSYGTDCAITFVIGT